MVPKSSAIARIDGVTNAVVVEGDFVGQLVLSGPGAGGDATASAVMSDIADIARGDRVGTFGRPASSLEPYRRAGDARARGRLLHPPRRSTTGRARSPRSPGAWPTSGISLESIVQRRRAPQAAAPEHPVPVEPQPVILITYETTEDGDPRRARRHPGATAISPSEPQMIRIEQLG